MINDDFDIDPDNPDGGFIKREWISTFPNLQSIPKGCTVTGRMVVNFNEQAQADRAIRLVVDEMKKHGLVVMEIRDELFVLDEFDPAKASYADLEERVANYYKTTGVGTSTYAGNRVVQPPLEIEEVKPRLTKASEHEQRLQWLSSIRKRNHRRSYE